jgi:hypothetical protein
MGEALLATLIGDIAWQGLRLRCCRLHGSDRTSEGEHRGRLSCRQHLRHGWGRWNHREGHDEAQGRTRRDEFREFRQHRSDRPIHRRGGPLLDPGLRLTAARGIGGGEHQEAVIGGDGLHGKGSLRDICPLSSMTRPIAQQGSKPVRSLLALQGRQREGLELVEPIQAPAVHAALKAIEALVAAALAHRLQQASLWIRAGRMGRWS